MNFRRILTRKLTMVIPVMAMAALAIALVAVPVGAINQAPAPSSIGEVLNSPIPVPSMINYQGYLTDPDGNPINGTLSMTFSIYETAVGGTAVWTETQSVTVTNGLFNVLLGSVNPINVSHLTGVSYLGIKVGSDPEMTPRQRLASVAYALRSGVANLANNAESLDGMGSADFVAVAGDTMTGQLILPANGLVAGTNQLVLTGGKVGIGTTTPGSYKLNVYGGSSDGIFASGNTFGIQGASSSGTGVFGYNYDTSNHGRVGTGSEGVFGYHGSTGNIGRLGTNEDGVAGYSNVDIGSGVYGHNTAAGYGVYGRNINSDNYGYLGSSSYGAYGEHWSGNCGQLGTSGEGVYGFHSSSGNYGRLGTGNDGVYGRSTNGYGVFGIGYYGVVGSGDNTGVYGSGDNIGVYGFGDNIGVYGYNRTNSNYGRLGTSGEGVYGYNYSSGNYGRLGTGNDGVAGVSSVESGSGVYGLNTGAGYGVLGRNGSFNNYGILGTINEGVYGYGTSGSWSFFAGGTLKYGPFTGAHEVKLAAGFPEDVGPGLIVSANGESQIRTEEGEISYSSTLPTVQLADTPNDKAVFGVLIKEAPLPEDHWYQAAEGERFGIVNALGEGRVWATNINGDIETGDYITTSAIAGYGQKQDDDLLHSYTLSKAIETIDWNNVTETVDFNGQTYKAYAIAVVYTSG